MFAFNLITKVIRCAFDGTGDGGEEVKCEGRRGGGGSVSAFLLTESAGSAGNTVLSDVDLSFLINNFIQLESFNQPLSLKITTVSRYQIREIITEKVSA